MTLATGAARAQGAPSGFDQWVIAFRPKAVARGVSDATYTRVMVGLKPDTSVYALIANQDEFNEALWQYLNRRASDWRIRTGKERAKQYASLLARIEQDYGVDRYILLSLWGIEFELRRRHRQSEIHAAGDSGARRARLWRAAAAQLLGSRNCSTRWSSSIAAGAIRNR